ncbi:MAG TPA: hypothetical protein VJH65_01730 [Candidatus Nanoarchaeia archaeon]|nr:hypothetical protein [Candidatus Nanoarchaeia archaeon]
MKKEKVDYYSLINPISNLAEELTRIKYTIQGTIVNKVKKGVISWDENFELYGKNLTEILSQEYKPKLEEAIKAVEKGYSDLIRTRKKIEEIIK